MLVDSDTGSSVESTIFSIYFFFSKLRFPDFRCACRACRFDKCVAAGMNPKAIHYPGKGAESPEHLQMVPVTISQMNCEDFEYSQKLKLMVIITKWYNKHGGVQVHREKIIQQMRTVQSPIFPTEDLDQILRQPCLFGKHNCEQVSQILLDIHGRNVHFRARSILGKFWA